MSKIAPINHLVEELIKHPQVEMSVQHRFAPGVYYREIHMPAGTFVIGAIHRTEHFNIVLRGSAKVAQIIGEEVVVTDVRGPRTFISSAGVQKVLYILEDMDWVTIHPTTETDIHTLEDLLIENPGDHRRYLESVEQLRRGIACRLP